MQEQPVTSSVGQVWNSGDAYEPFVGRWSRLVGRQFLSWLGIPAGADWLDLGCGTGALTGAIVDSQSPRSVTGVDRSEGFVAYAREHVSSPLVSFETGDATKLRFRDRAFDAAVSALVLNFVPDRDAMIREMSRVVRAEGTVALYVWDYSGKMEMLRYFWDSAVAQNPNAQTNVEGVRFQICQPGPLSELFRKAGLAAVDVQEIDVPTVFRNFDDYWSPFLGGQGPASSYAMSLDERERAALRELLRAALPAASDGSIRLVARAWAVRGLVR